MAETDLQYSIRKTKELFRRRQTGEDWARNLLEGSRRLKTVDDWDMYYAFIANPDAYEENKIPARTGTCCVHEGVPTDYPDFMEVRKVINGGETIIHVINKRSRGEDDEKSPT
jgi:hypothetical protein